MLRSSASSRTLQILPPMLALHRRITMKLTLEKNNGDKVVVEYKKDCITDLETELSVEMSLEPLWEALKAKLEAKQNG